jgi:hypothetical protein
MASGRMEKRLHRSRPPRASCQQIECACPNTPVVVNESGARKAVPFPIRACADRRGLLPAVPLWLPDRSRRLFHL